MAPVVYPDPEERMARQVRKALQGRLGNPDQWAQLDELVQLARAVRADFQAISAELVQAVRQVSRGLQDLQDRRDPPA